MNSGADASSFGWLKGDETRVTAIVGICKNAGKTTLLNHLLSLCNNQTWGVFSTGIDGEETDTVYNIPKPPVKLGPDTLFCCDTHTLDGLGSSVCVLEKLAGSPTLRPLWLTRTMAPIQTQITGPPTLSGQIQTAERMRDLGAEKILIDGSLDRKSIALSDAVDAIAVMIGASFGGIPAISAEIRRLEILNSVPPSENILPNSPQYKLLLDSERLCVLEDGNWAKTDIESLIGNEAPLRGLLEQNPEQIYVPGAITDSVFTKIREPLKQAGTALLLRHPDCLKLSYPRLEQFAREFSPQTLITFKIEAYVLNTLSMGTQNIAAEDFRTKLRGEFPHLELPDIRELKT